METEIRWRERGRERGREEEKMMAGCGGRLIIGIRQPPQQHLIL